MTERAFGIRDFGAARRVALGVLGIPDTGQSPLHGTYRGVPVEVYFYRSKHRGFDSVAERCQVAAPAHFGALGLESTHGGTTPLPRLARPTPPELAGWHIFVSPAELGPDVCDDAVLARLAWLHQQNPGGVYGFRSDGRRLLLKLGLTASPDALRTMLDTIVLASGNVQRGLARLHAAGVDLVAFERQAREQQEARTTKALLVVAAAMLIALVVVAVAVALTLSSSVR